MHRLSQPHSFKKSKVDIAPASAQQTDVDGSTAGPIVRAPRRNLRGKRGSLANMPNMPVDILLEVCVLEVVISTKLITRTDFLISDAARAASPRQNLEGVQGLSFKQELKAHLEGGKSKCGGPP